MSIYGELGLNTLINCAGTYTIIGGSKMSENVTNAMKEAAKSHVEIRLLQEKVHEKIAELTGNESAIVTAGAIVGVYLSMASCISLKYQKQFKLLTKKEISESEIIMFRAHRNAYDRGLDLIGAKLVELGYPNNINIIDEEEFENAITDKTVGVLYLPSTNGGWVPPGALPIDKTIEICKKYDVPVIVDAAAQLPPKSNLWNFTKSMGASAVIFSGGKYLKGPQGTGLVLGEEKLLYWLNKNNFPNYDIGRMHKIGRESIVGIYAAVKEYVESDEQVCDQEAEKIVAKFVESFNENDRFHFKRVYPNEAGQPMARAQLFINDSSLSAEELKDKLSKQTRSIFTMIENGYIYINPMMMTSEEAEYVLNVFQILNKEEN